MTTQPVHIPPNTSLSIWNLVPQVFLDLRPHHKLPNTSDSSIVAQSTGDPQVNTDHE